jgi:lysine 2,3-aminomutase
MQDKIEKIGKSIVQHGKINDRIYLMKFDPDDASAIIPELNKLVSNFGYSKIFAKIPTDAFPYFVEEGYKIEAFIPRFYSHKTDCLFASKFLNKDRMNYDRAELRVFRDLLNNSSKEQKALKETIPYKIVNLSESDANEISEIFKVVFETYPFPVHDPDYIRETIKIHGTRYFGVLDNEKLIGISTAEIDTHYQNAEMTDFAVLPSYRGKKLALRLLEKMESEMKNDNIKTVYTIARLKEPGMNKTFLNAGYKYTGTLINNTNISGRIESMNVLYKHL